MGNLYDIEDSVTGTAARKTKSIFLGSTRVAGITGSDIAFYHQDHLGSTNVMSDKAGLARSLTEYDPFGKIARFEKYGSKIPSGWQYFHDKSFDDESGLSFFGGRYYDSKLGRFITADTIVPYASDPQSLNRYSYCRNNPINLIDPTGHKWSWGKIFSSFFKAVVQVVAYTVLAAIPILGPIGAGILVGAISGGFGGGGSFSLQGALMGAALGGLGGAAFGTNGVNGFLGAAGRNVGVGLLAAGAAYSGATGGLEGLATFGAGVAGAVVGGGIGNSINKVTQGNTAGTVRAGEMAQKSTGSNTPIGAKGTTTQGALNVDQGKDVVGGQALNNKKGISIRLVMNTEEGPVVSASDGPRDVKVIGRLPDTAVAKNWPGHDVLDLPSTGPNKWTPARNAQWVDEGIVNKQPFYTASSESAQNVTATTYGGELLQIKSAGYTKAGDTYNHPNAGN